MKQKFEFSTGIFFTTLAVVMLYLAGCDLPKIEDEGLVPIGETPEADFSFSGGNFDAPCNVNFTNASAQAISFEWNFGDGSPVSAAFNPTHTYTSCGDFIVTLVAVNGAKTDTLRKPITINCITFEVENTSLGSGVSVTQIASGGYVVVGTANVGGNSQIYSIRYSSEGVASPPVYYGSTKNEYGTDVLTTTSGGVMILGVTTNSSSDRLEGYFTAENNNTTPTKIALAGKDVWLNAVVEMSDGGFMITGKASNPTTGIANILMVRINANLTIATGFPIEISLPNDEEANDLVLLPNGNFAVIGTARETTNQEEILLVFVNASGTIVGAAKYFGGNSSDYGKGIVCTEDEQFLFLLGTTASIGQGSNDVYLTKTDLNGIVTGNFPKTFGTAGSEVAGGIDKTADGGCIITGAKSGLVSLIKTTADGLVTGTGFERTFGEAAKIDGGGAIKTTNDSGFIICGQKDFDISTFSGHLYLIKTDKNGAL